MSPVEFISKLYKTVNNKYIEQFGFPIKETTFSKIVEYLHRPKDSSSLAVTRILFGLAMLFDIPDERGGARMERRWGGNICHFPLTPLIQAEAMPYMALVYAALWLGAVGIMLGYKYKLSSITFAACYWYLILVEKSFWNNHSYLFGLVGLLLAFTEANCYWSIDAYLNPSQKKATVPYWNYFILKYQFFILYFMAGMKKGTAEWLTGYSVQKLSEHWVFDPFKFFLTVPQIDYLIVHWFIFAFDLTVAVWMMWARTRHVAMIFCAMFHLMNSRLFRIGMFPWVCLATMPLYYPFNWPKIVLKYIDQVYTNLCAYFSLKFCIYKTKADLMAKDNETDPRNDKSDDGSDHQTDGKMKEDNTNKLEDPMEYLNCVMEYVSENYNNKHDLRVKEVKLSSDSQTKPDAKTEDPMEFINCTEYISENYNNKHDVRVKPDSQTKPETKTEDSMESINSITEYISENYNNKHITLKHDIEFTETNCKSDAKIEHPKDEPMKTDNSKNKKDQNKTKALEKIRTYMIMFHVITQLFLPYSHFITKGYNNWTNGLYGYSWDMMVHTWDTQSIVVKVVDNDFEQELYIDPSMFTLSDRWSRHGDMVYQYAHCLKDILLKERTKFGYPMISENFSIYIDVWCSMNGRFTQRLFDSKVDMLATSWSPFKEVSYLMPLLDEAIHWRSTLDKITEEVHNWKNDTDVIFLADFPGYEQEKYIPLELQNITLTVLEGAVGYEPEATLRPGICYYLNKGDHTQVHSGLFHKILVIGEKPAYYMYIFMNSTETNYAEDVKEKPKLPIFNELYMRFKGMYIFGSIVINSFYRIFFGCNGIC